MPSRFVPLPPRPVRSDEELVGRAREFADAVATRRTVRHFDRRPVPRAVIEAAIRAAGTAPSGAHKQPWHFVAVGDPALKRAIREAAEAEERRFYASAPQEWLEALAPFGTDADKPSLETAPWLVAVFAQRHGTRPDGTRDTHYYVQESVGIATGLLITALHHAGLATLTHTPSPMGFLNTLLGRPANERAVVLLVTGHPAADARVPALSRKPLDAIATFHDATGDARP